MKALIISQVQIAYILTISFLPTLGMAQISIDPETLYFCEGITDTKLLTIEVEENSPGIILEDDNELVIQLPNGYEFDGGLNSLSTPKVEPAAFSVEYSKLSPSKRVLTISLTCNTSPCISRMVSAKITFPDLPIKSLGTVMGDTVDNIRFGEGTTALTSSKNIELGLLSNNLNPELTLSYDQDGVCEGEIVSFAAIISDSNYSAGYTYRWERRGAGGGLQGAIGTNSLFETKVGNDNTVNLTITQEEQGQCEATANSLTFSENVTGNNIPIFSLPEIEFFLGVNDILDASFSIRDQSIARYSGTLDSILVINGRRTPDYRFDVTDTLNRIVGYFYEGSELENTQIAVFVSNSRCQVSDTLTFENSPDNIFRVLNRERVCPGSDVELWVDGNKLEEKIVDLGLSGTTQTVAERLQLRIFNRNSNASGCASYLSLVSNPIQLPPNTNLLTPGSIKVSLGNLPPDIYIVDLVDPLAQCLRVTSIPIEVGGYEVKAVSRWKGPCERRDIEFENLTQIPGIQEPDYSYKWDIFQGPARTERPILKKIEESFVSNSTTFPVGAYQYVFTIRETESKVCIEPDTQRFFRLAQGIVDLDTGYLENFTNASAPWIAIHEDLAQLPSWKQQGIDTSIFPLADSGNVVWQVAAFQSREASYIYSPCFDLSGLERPMISFDYYSQLRRQRNGVALQISLDEGQTWQLIGSIGSGNNWYDTENIDGIPRNESNPRSYGWSSRSEGWQHASHALDRYLENLQLPESNDQVIFRFALGAAPGDHAGEGFAVDNIRITERTRNVLVEQFVADQASLFWESLAEANPQDMVLMQVRTDFLSEDGLFSLSPEVMQARMLQYGIGPDDQVLFAGGRSQGPCILDLPANLDSCQAANTVNLRSLDQALITIPQIQISEQNGEVEAEIDLMATQELTEAQELVVHVFLVANEIDRNIPDGLRVDTSARNVLITALPDAGGTYLSEEWISGNVRKVTIPAEGSPAILLESLPGFAQGEVDVVVAVQDLHTREIYQVKRQATEIELPWDGDVRKYQVESSLSTALEFEIMPNPAHGQVHISSSYPLDQPLTWVLQDSEGRKIQSGGIQKGVSKWSIDLSGYATGLYHVSITNGIERILHQKLLIY